ncbi:MAG: poly-gamma-glutamate biosynthesis protein PgsC [Treponema sp.]|nr:poly-gamma-glutamate biosynthesis protein PgsC [Treponema sp.]
MSIEAYIVTGIILGLLFTELAGLSPGGIIVPGYLALFLSRPLELLLTAAAAALVMLCLHLLSRLFFIFGRRRYALALILGLCFKLLIEHLAALPGISGLPATLGGIQIIGWLIPGIIAHDFYKQGIGRTLLAAGTVTSLVFLIAQGAAFVLN